MERGERISRSDHARNKRAQIKRIKFQRSENLYAHLDRLREKKKKFHLKHPYKEKYREVGGPTRTRTSDQRIMSPLL